MVCERCRTSDEGTFQRGASRPGLRGAERLSALFCVGCGAALPTENPTDLMLHKLAQLARFGLTSEGGPLLESSPRTD